LLATKQCNSPFEHCDVVTSTTHKSLRGPRSGIIFCRKSLEDAINGAVFPTLQGGPHNHQIAALAVALKEASTPQFVEYIAQVKRNAVVLAESLRSFGYKIVTDGTDNHLVLWDARPTGLSGAKLEKLFEACDISVNKNSVVGDTSAVSPGGIRLGTPAMTTRGMVEQDMRTTAQLLHEVVQIGLTIQASKEGELGAAAAAVGGKTLKLKDFLQAMRTDPFEQQLRAVADRVQRYAETFALPGIDPRSRDIVIDPRS